MRNYLFILPLLITLGACHSKKKLITDKPISIDSLPMADSLSIMKGDGINRKGWEYFSGRLGVDYSDGENEDMSGNISLRMRRDSIIWFSVSVAMGIQVAKGIITHDSVTILDLYHKEYVTYGISDLSATLGTEVSLRNLQNIILGNPVFDTLSYRYDTASRGWFAAEPPVTNLLFTNGSNNVDSSFVVQKGTGRQLKALYEGNRSAGSFDVAETLWLTAFGDKKTVRFRIAFTTASDAFIPSYPFRIPDDYRKKE